MNPSRASKRGKAALNDDTVNPRVTQAQEQPDRPRTRSQTAQAAPKRPNTRAQAKAALSLNIPAAVSSQQQPAPKSSKQQSKAAPKSTGTKSRAPATKPADSQPEKPAVKGRRAPRKTVKKQPAQSQPSKSTAKGKKPSTQTAEKQLAVTAPSKNGPSGKAHRPQVAKSTKAHSQRLNKSLLSRLSPWLSSLEEESPQSPPQDPPTPPEVDLLDDLEIRSVSSNPVSVVVMPAGASSSGPSRPSVNEEEYDEQLVKRNADPNAVHPKDPSEHVKQLKKDLDAPTDFKLSASKLESLRKVAEEFLRQTRDSDSTDDQKNWMPQVDQFREELRKALPACSIMTTTKDEFEADKLRSMTSNEHIIQRTIMMTAIDRWQLESVFNFNCERRWTSMNPHKLPTPTVRGTFPANQPDLAISFNAEAIRHGIHRVLDIKYFEDLRYCLYPDKDMNCWFPFLFIEAKKKDGSLSSARSRNMHHASQALHNIYHCLSKAKLAEKFVDVRTFSIVLAPDQFELRVHRAELDQSGLFKWQYFFETVYCSSDYSRDKLALVMQSVLKGYASKTLLLILRDTYSRLIYLNKNNRNLLGTRNGLSDSASSAPSSNDTATEQDTGQSEPGDDIAQSQEPLQPMLPTASSFNHSSQGSAVQSRKRKGKGKSAGTGAKKIR